MQTLSAVMGGVGPGEVEIEVPYRADLIQQHGFIHGGIVTAIVDSACRYAALSTRSTSWPRPRESVYWPGGGGAARRHPRLCKGDVLAYDGGEDTPVDTMLSTIIITPNRPDLAS